MKYEKEKARQLYIKNDSKGQNKNIAMFDNIINKITPSTVTQTTPSQIEVKKLSRDTTPQIELNDDKSDTNNNSKKQSGEMIAVRAPRRIKRYIDMIK